MRTTLKTSLATAALLQGLASAQTSSTAKCSSTLTASYAAPSMADGYASHIVANGLKSPRGMVFDSQGALLVIQEGVGISAHNVVDGGNNCLSISSSKVIVNDPGLNHGIQLSEDGATLYASTGESVYAWDYSAKDQKTTSSNRTLVNGMSGTDHTSRTLLLSRKVPGMMVVNRGSFENIDTRALDMSTGVSQVRAFNISNATSSSPYNYTTSGKMLGWGLRNDVGIAEHPTTGGIWSVENSADQLNRSSTDIHTDNPAEELNFLGYLNGTMSRNQGRNFGYPTCFTAWSPKELPNFSGKVGEQFAINNISATNNDTTCDEANHQAPRLSFAAHMAPLDIKFNPTGTAAWISFHGSWNRNSPIGYKLSVVEFANGHPVEANTSTTAARDIMSNPNLSACPKGCFRPVGLAWDGKGRLFMSSDSTGEIYVITRTDGKNTSMAGSDAPGTIPNATNSNVSTTGSGASTTTSPGAAAGAVSVSMLAVLGGVFAFFL